MAKVPGHPTQGRRGARRAADPGAGRLGRPAGERRLRIVAAVPAFREAARIAAVVRGALRHLPCLVVDDGSDDGTADAAREAGAEVVFHAKNRGKGAALRTAFAWAAEHGYDGAITLDGDGQHDPVAILLFVAAAEAGADIVVGRRTAWRERGMPWIRRQVNSLTSAVVSRLAHAEVADSQCGYRYVSVRAWTAASPATDSFDAESEILIRAGRLGLRIAEVRIATIYGDEVSKVRPLADTLRFIRLALRCMTGRW